MVRIRITGSEKNKNKGFYLLITNGSVASFKLEEYIIDEELLKVLDKHNIKYNLLY